MTFKTAALPFAVLFLNEAVIVDDGGAYFFNVQFDVESGSFDSLRFNGYA